MYIKRRKLDAQGLCVHVRQFDAFMDVFCVYTYRGVGVGCVGGACMCRSLCACLGPFLTGNHTEIELCSLEMRRSYICFDNFLCTCACACVFM